MKKRTSVVYIGVILVIVCAFIGLNKLIFAEKRPIIYWSENQSAEEYFKYSNEETASGGTSTSDALTIIPYAETKDFSGQREQLEADEVIPKMESHPFHCNVHYNADGSIFSVNFSWLRSGAEEDYSHLTIIAGCQEVELIEDHIVIERDKNGNILEPNITVTKRDGVQIIAEGSENRGKTITFQNDSGWYQITGSARDSYASMVMLLDWLWEHPIDFDRFSME